MFIIYGVYESVWKGGVMKTDPRYVLVNLYQTIPKVWLWKMVVRQLLSCEVYSCILFQRAARGSRMFSNMADILSEVMHFRAREVWPVAREFVVTSDQLLTI